MIRKSMSSSANNAVWAMAGDTSRLAPPGKLARGGPGTHTKTGAVLFVRRAEGSHHHRLLLKGFLCWVGRARDAGTKTPSTSFTAGSDQQGDEVGLVLERCGEQRGGGERAQLATAMESHGEDVTVPV